MRRNQGHYDVTVMSRDWEFLVRDTAYSYHWFLCQNPRYAQFIFRMGTPLQSPSDLGFCLGYFVRVSG